jgi:hypothetical protein
MVCGFLQKLSLSSLVAPVADAEFRSRYWERQPLVVHRKDPDYYDGLDAVDRGRACCQHNGGDSVRINYGARAIVFPSFFREALEFALNHPAYVIREIPGDLEDEERIAFAERLLEEGLVVRKASGRRSRGARRQHRRC